MKTHKACVDDGHRNTKGHRNGNDFIIPSLIINGASNSDFNLTGDPNTLPPSYRTDENGQDAFFTVLDQLRYGQADQVIQTDNEEYLTSAANRVLIHHMLHRMGYGGQKVVLCTTCPLQRYFNRNGQKNQLYLKRRKENLMKPVYQDSNGQAVTVVDHVEMPEALVAFYDDLIVLEKRKNKTFARMNEQIRNQNLLYLDLGGQSLDVAVISNGQPDFNNSFSVENAGSLSLYNDLRDLLRNYRKHITTNEMDEVLRTGLFKANRRSDEMLDMTKQVNELKQGLLTRALDQVKKRINLADFDLIRALGGTSMLLKDDLAKVLPEAEMVSKPLFTTVRGQQKYMSYIHKMDEETVA